jgi:DNA-binding LacI/PurR family transcriptional regulator
MSATAKTNRERAKAYRERMRAKGMRLVQMWVIDTRTEEFKRQAQADSLAIRNSPTEAEDQAFVDFNSEWNDPDSETWRNEK